MANSMLKHFPGVVIADSDAKSRVSVAASLAPSITVSRSPSLAPSLAPSVGQRSIQSTKSIDSPMPKQICAPSVLASTIKSQRSAALK